jgi:Putative peptidoglycan binding domain/N-acetylmuramoyl-L-alanine amidase
MALKRVSIPSPNVSSRGGEKVRLIVVHTSEGAQSYQSLGSFFANPSSQVSSHTGIDDTAGTIGEYVGRSNKAWTSANANPVAVQTELCTPSGAAQGWSAATWNSHATMLSNCAAWIAEEAAQFKIPIVKLSPQQAQSGSAGVCGHGDLGSWGGGHTDPGPNFPWSQVIAMATGQAPAPAPSPPSPAPAPTPGGPAPAFPYPSSDYLGPPSSDPHCHSGYYGGADQTNVATWQRQMLARGWSGIGAADGMYGPASQSVCRQFQQEKGLGADGLVGPQTWAATWTAAVT